MIPEYVVTPVVGAIIGYFTNWLAIKMIFRPYTEKRIFNIKLPFTPGLMPKERYVLSKKVGAIISEHLLTEEVMVKALISDNIHENINSLIEKGLDNLKNEDKTLNELLKFISIDIDDESSNFDLSVGLGHKISDIIFKMLQQETLQANAIEVIVREIEKIIRLPIKDMPIEKLELWIKNRFLNYGVEYIASEDFENLIKDNLFNWINNINNNEKTINEIVTSDTQERLKLLIQDKVPDISKLILSLVENPMVEEKIKELIIHLIDENVGKFITIFINSVKVSESIITSFKQYLSDENNYPKTSEIVIAYLEKFSTMKVNEIADKVPEDYKNYPISDVIIKTIRKFCTQENISQILNSLNGGMAKLENKNIYDILINIEPNIIDNGKQYLKEQLNKALSQESLYLYINKTVDSQINIVMNKTLKDITANIQEDNIVIIKKILLKAYDFIVKKAMVNMLKAMNISKIVEDRINDFEIKEAEDIVLQVVNKELKSITLIGGLLGFVIGLLPAFMNY